MDGTYNQLSLNNGNVFPTNTLSDTLLDPNFFGSVSTAAATPLISQAGSNLNQHTFGYSHSQAYMPQEVTMLKERCKTLEAHLMRVTTERDTLKTMFEQLSASLQNQTTATAPPPSIKTAAIYPKIRFWTQSTFNNWTNTPEAHSNPRYKFAFIEDEEGNAVSEGTLKGIRKTIRGCWAELIAKDTAPQSWGKASTSAKEAVRKLAYKEFPFLELGESHWKIDALCSLDYPGWTRNNLDDQRKWLASQRVKRENDATDDSMAPGTNGRKRKAKLIKSEGREKKFKADIASDSSAMPTVSRDLSPIIESSSSSLSPAAESSLSSANGESTSPSPLSPVEDTTPAISLLPFLAPKNQGYASPDQPTAAFSASTPTTVQAVFPSRSPSPTLDIYADVSDLPVPAQKAAVAEAVGGNTQNESTEIDSDLRPAMDQSRQDITATSETHVATPIVVNPTSSLAKKSVKLKLPPLPPIPESVAKGKNKSDVEDMGRNGGTSDKDKDKSTSQMRPTKAKTPYNLCAFRWLAQLNKNGTAIEFREYWNYQLSKHQRETYKKEAKELVEKKAWDPDVVSQGTGTLH